MLDSLREFHKRNEEKQKRTAKLKRYLSEKTIKTSKDSKKKEIIRGISAYFNPGEMIAVMGPSGTELYLHLNSHPLSLSLSLPPSLSQAVVKQPS